MIQYCWQDQNIILFQCKSPMCYAPGTLFLRQGSVFMNEIYLQIMKTLAKFVTSSRLHRESELNVCGRFYSHAPAIGPFS